MHRILFPSRHTKCAHLTSISLPCILSRIRSCSSRLISVISDRHGRASAIIVLRKRDRERGTESIKANRVSSSSSRERKTISPYRVSPYFPLGLEVGRLPLRSSSRRSILSARAGSVARHRRAIKEKRIRVSRGNRGEWINNNGRRRYTGVLSAYAPGTQPLSIYTRHATLLERSSPFPTHPLPTRILEQTEQTTP